MAQGLSVTVIDAAPQVMPNAFDNIPYIEMQTYIPKICSIFLLTNRCSNSNIQLCKQMFVTSVRGIYNTDLQLMIQGGTVMGNENNTITGRTCQMSGNTSSRVHSGDVSRNRRDVYKRQPLIQSTMDISPLPGQPTQILIWTKSGLFQPDILRTKTKAV